MDKLNDYEILQIFLNQRVGLKGANSFLRYLKDIGVTGIDKDRIKRIIQSSEVYNIHRPIKEPKIYKPITSEGINDVIQIDLMDVSNLASRNKGIKWLFVAVDVFSRYGWVISLKDKTQDTIYQGMRKLLSYVVPNSIMCDNGSEFISKKFKDLCKRHKIKIDYVDVNNHLIPHVGNRLGIVDRFIQTLRDRIKWFRDARNTNTYINALDDLVFNINTTYNSGLKQIPNEVYNDPYKQIDVMNMNTEKVLKYYKHDTQRNLFKIGDMVRHVLQRTPFTKGEMNKWSKQTYKIIEKKGISYLLNNGKWYKYYMLQHAVDEVKYEGRTDEQTVDVVGYDEGTDEQIILNQENRSRRAFSKEGLNMDTIVESKRMRNPVNRLRY